MNWRILFLVTTASISSGCRLLNRHSSPSSGPTPNNPVTQEHGTDTTAQPTGTDPGFALVGPPLQAVGPIHPMHGFPMWYADSTGARVELCVDADQKCVAPPADYDPSRPTEFPDNFPGESFYWLAEGRIPLTTTGQFRILFALEAAFTTGVPAPGQRITFARTLFVAAGVPNGIYRITHPYGVNDVEVAGGRVRNVTDQGIAREKFDGILNSPFGTLLRWDRDAPIGYLGDGAIPHTFTGSPLGTNFFRIDTLQAGVLTTVGSAQLANIAGRLDQKRVAPSLMPNTFTTLPSLTLTPSEPGARVFYTVDNSDPKISGTRLPTDLEAAPGPLTITLTQTSGIININTISEKDGVYGNATNYQYTIDPNQISVSADPKPGIYSQPTSVTLTSQGPATEIRYTIDDTDPLLSPSAQVFNGTPIIVSTTGLNLIRIVGVRRGATGAVEAKSPERKAYFTIAIEKLTRSHINPAYELPFWVKDSTGLALAPCVDPNDTMCLPVPVGGADGIDSNLPIVYPRNYPGESFIWNASAHIIGGNGNNAELVLAVEGAFPIGKPAWGERAIFTRLRIRADLTTAGQYRVIHPYGVKYFNVTTTGTNAINFTEDIDPVANDFDAFRFGHIGPFLRWDIGVPAGYVGDPNLLHTVTGSPGGTNFFRIERLIGTQYAQVMFTDQFTLSGKIAAPLEVDASPMGAFYTSPQQVTLTASDTTAKIWYTIDGTIPVIGSNGAEYTGPIPITQSTTIKFIASLPTGLATAAKTSIYTIDTTQPVITAQPPGGGYSDRVTVTLSANRPSAIYYTLDSSSPLDSLSRSLYSTPIALAGPSQRNLNAVAIDQTGMASPVRSDSYSFSMTLPIVSSPTTSFAANAVVTANNIPTDTSWSTQTFGGRTINSYRLERNINGGAFTQVPLTTPTTNNQRILLTAGRNYEYRVSATDSGGLSSIANRSGVFNLAALQEAAGAITYRGTWLRTVATNFFGGTARSTTGRNASATIRFTGSQVAWITAIGPTMGIATVTLDGVPQGNFDLYSRTNTGSVLKFVRTGLPRAVHTLVITATGTRNTASTGNRVDVDAVAVIN